MSEIIPQYIKCKKKAKGIVQWIFTAFIIGVVGHMLIWFFYVGTYLRRG